MRHLSESVRKSVQCYNFYAALAGALALPDIAGKLDGRTGGSKPRFISWFDDYILPSYTVNVGGHHHVFLSGEDCYALRCAYLHEGEFDITSQPVQDALERFIFVAAPPGTTVHRNQSHLTLQLQVDIFCEEICTAADEWLKRRGSDPNVAAAIAKLPSIRLLEHGLSF